MSELPRGAQVGEGVYTTLLWQGGPPATWPLHLARLQRDAAQVGLPPPPLETLRQQIDHYLTQCPDPSGQGEPLWRLRIRWWADGGNSLAEPAVGGVLELSARALAADERAAGPVRLVTAGPARWPRRWAGAKITSIGEDLAWRHWALGQGADDAVLCDAQGNWSETPTAALLLGLEDGRLATPGPDSWPVRSTSLQALAERLRALGQPAVAAVRLGPADRAQVRWMLLLNAVIGARPVAELDGARLQAPPLALQQLALELTQPVASK